MVKISKGNKKQVMYLVEKEYQRLSTSAKPGEKRKLKKAIKQSIINQLK